MADLPVGASETKPEHEHPTEGLLLLYRTIP